MTRKRPKPPTTPRPALSTRRQQLRDRLVAAPADFDELRREFRLSPRDLEDELGHLERSLGRELTVVPAQCLSCDQEIAPRPNRRLHAPRRCPHCRAERVSPPIFSIEDDGDG